MPASWYIVWAIRGKEFKAKSYCDKLKITSYLPLFHTTKSTTNQQNNLVFPSMMFIKMGEDQLSVLQASSYIKNFMYFLDRPATISEPEIEALKLFLEKHPTAEPDKIPVKSPDLTEINSPLQLINVTPLHTVLHLPSIGYKLTANTESQYALFNKVATLNTSQRIRSYFFFGF